MTEVWFREWPDLTTETILHIDRELAKTEQIRQEVRCLICDKPGIHTHWKDNK